MSEISVVTQDEIIWKLKEVHFDSTSIYQDTVRSALRQKLDLDALVTRRFALDEINEAVSALEKGGIEGRAILEF